MIAGIFCIDFLSVFFVSINRKSESWRRRKKKERRMIITRFEEEESDWVRIKGEGDLIWLFEMETVESERERECANSLCSHRLFHWLWYLLSHPFSNNVEVQSRTECHGMIWRRLCGCFPSPIFSSDHLVPFSFFWWFFGLKLNRCIFCLFWFL